MANIAQLVTVIPGQLITDTLWNNEFQNIINSGLTPAGVEDYSATDAEFQTQTDPYPSSIISRPTSMQGELERIRYQLAQILGTTYHYQDVPTLGDLTNLTSRVDDLEVNLLAPSGTVMVFYQAAAPTGWTKSVAQNDKALRVVSGSGGVAGGTAALSTAIPLAHTHTVDSHTHTIASDGAHTHTVASHTHTGPSHTHTGPSHTHTVPMGGWTGFGGATSGRLVYNHDGGGIDDANLTTPTSDNTSGASGTGDTGAAGTGATGAATPATDSQGAHTHGGATGGGTSATGSSLTDVSLAYIDVIIASKD